VSAIEHLRPAQRTTRDNQRSWPYLICQAEYLDACLGVKPNGSWP
jgi:hypothetical protein